MHIAYVTETYPPEINGVSLTAARTVDWLRAAGHRVQLIRPRQADEPPRDDASEWRTAGRPIPMYPDLRFGWARSAAFLQRWRRQPAGLPDVVHVATPGPLALSALRAAALARIPATADFRTNFHAYSRHYGFGWAEPLVLAWLRRLHSRSRLNFVPTQALAHELAALGFARLAVLGRGVDARRFSPARRDRTLRESWQAAPGDPVLLWVGRLAPEKNVELAFEVFERLRRRQPRTQMIVVGDGPLARRLEIAHPRARFVGTKRGDELARHFASADIFLFPSLTETFGNVTLEAMASGLLVVAYDLAAARQHLRDGASGFLAASCTREGFFDAALRAMSALRAGGRFDPLVQPAIEHPMRRQARQAAQRADWDSVLKSFEQHLLAATAAARGRIGDAALA